MRFVLLILAGAGLAGCAHDGTDRAYAGSPGSTYDAAGNPPRAHGAATYDASAAIVPHDYGNGGDGAAAPAR